MSADDERAGLREGGSASARRFDPRVRATRWVTLAARPWPEFVKELQARARLDDAALERVLRHGGIWLDKHPVPLRARTREVRDGAHVAVYAFEREPEPVPLGEDCILLDRDGVVAVKKPAWLPVQGTRASQLHSLERMIAERLGCAGLRAAHRLDRQTSGVLLLARDAKRAAFLGRALHDRHVAKLYLAWVSPAPREDAWTVRGPLGPAKIGNRYRFELRDSPAPDARDSETHFRVVERTGERALVECRPITGRTHQLRVHLAAGGTPIVGDELYGPDHREGAASSAERILLHAERLTLRLAPGETETEIRAPLPADFGVRAGAAPAEAEPLPRTR
jgi:RluA family pseudouridine synthase